MQNVMYHYVRPSSQKYPYFKNLDLETFKRQLDYFEDEYGFISKEDYFNAIKYKKNISGVTLSFDDGLKDHYLHVLPELKKRNLWATFYITTGIYNNKNTKMLGVHRAHFLIGKYGATKILKDTLKMINKNMLDEKNINVFDKEIYSCGNYDKDSKELRRLLNFYLKYEYRDIILDELMSMYFDEKKLFEETYLSIKELKEITKCGNILGAHTVNHPVLSRLSKKLQFKEINESFEFLSKIYNMNYKSFSYPYGYKSSYNDKTIEILNLLKIDNAVVFDDALQNIPIKKYELSRIDCNQYINF